MAYASAWTCRPDPRCTWRAGQLPGPQRKPDRRLAGLDGKRIGDEPDAEEPVDLRDPAGWSLAVSSASPTVVDAPCPRKPVGDGPGRAPQPVPTVEDPASSDEGSPGHLPGGRRRGTSFVGQHPLQRQQDRCPLVGCGISFHTDLVQGAGVPRPGLASRALRIRPVRVRQSGRLPCLRGGRLSRLVRSISRARMSLGLVS